MRASFGWIVAFVWCAACSDGGTRPTRPEGSSGQGGTLGGELGGGEGGESSASGATGSCDEVLVSGTVDGQSVDGVLGLNRGVSTGTTPDWQSLKWVYGGGLFAFGSGSTSTGSSVSGKALLSAPRDYDLNGRQLFSDAFSATFGDGTKPAVLAGLRDLGACPGSAATGTLTLCVAGVGDSSCASDFAISGTVDGTTADFSSSTLDLVHVTFEGEERLGGTFSDDGYVILEGFQGQMQGVLILPTAHPDSGRVLCVGEATSTKTGVDTTYELADLSFSVATMPGSEISGSLEIVNCE